MFCFFVCCFKFAGTNLNWKELVLVQKRDKYQMAYWSIFCRELPPPPPVFYPLFLNLDQHKEICSLLYSTV